jgi:hypothetical protein
MSKLSAQRAKAAEELLAEVERVGGVFVERKGGFSSLSLTRDGVCRASVTFMGMGHTVTTKGANAREALTRAYEFHKMRVDGFNNDGRW